MFIQILVIYILFTLLIIIGSYYADLFASKDEYTKEDFKMILPSIMTMARRIQGGYTVTVFIVTSVIGMAVPLLSANIVVNSSLLFLVVYLLLPLVKKQLDKAKVINTESYSEKFLNNLMSISDVLIIAFGFGTGTGLIYSWSVLNTIPFLWFLLHLSIIILLLGIKVRKMMTF